MIYFDRKIWKQDFVSNDHNSAWRCGRCGVGSLQLIQKLTIARSTHSSQLKCVSPSCGMLYRTVGTIKPFASGGEVSPSYYRIEDYRVYPTHFQPELVLFELPLTLNEEIKIKLVKSFNHFWYDLDACANKIRQAIELIIKEKNGSGPNLDQKIKSLKESLGDQLTIKLLALKEVGNDGSHANRPFERHEILDIYSILVDVLNQLYPDESESVRRESLAQLIVEKRGMKNL